MDANDNELAYLEAIHFFVEVLDSFFGNVCELDLVFNFYKVCFDFVSEAWYRYPKRSFTGGLERGHWAGQCFVALRAHADAGFPRSTPYSMKFSWLERLRRRASRLC